MQLLQRAIDAGPAVLCHVEGSQGKRIRDARNIALRSTPRSGIHAGSAPARIRHKPRSELMPASMANPSQSPTPFVDQRPDGPGVSKIDPSDPAAPMYRLLAKMRSPVTLRDLMIHLVRTGYIGQEQT